MQIERARIDDLISERNPRRSLQHTRCSETVPQRRRFEIEAARYLIHCVGNGAVVERAGAGADQVCFIAVLVDGMRGLGWSGCVEHDLEDDVDPGAIDCTDDKGRVVGVRVGGGVGVEEQGRLVVCLGVV